MALDLATKAKIRRHLGLPAAGTNPGGSTAGLRTVTRAGQLEYYMNALQLEEEAIITGRPYGSVAISDPVTVGDTIKVFVTPSGAASPTTIQYTIQGTDNAQSVVQKLSALMSPVLSGFIIAQNLPLPPMMQLGLMSTTGVFTLNALSQNATTNVVVIANGTQWPSPSYSIDDGGGNPAKAVVAYGLLPVCDALETQLLNASQNLSYSNVGATSTGGATFRPDELIVRKSLLTAYRRELGVMLGFLQPDAASGARGGFGIVV